VQFELKSLSSEYVAQYAVKKMFKNKFYIIPGFTIKLIKLFSKITPTIILSKIAYYMQKKKM
jgi:short-subunit dehydrogenase